MKKFILLIFTAALALWAADFWQTKPYTNWDQKEIQKILTDSPWAKKVSAAMPGVGGLGAGGGDAGGGGGGGRGGRSGPQGPNSDPGISGGGGGGIAETSGIGRGGIGGGGGGPGDSFTPAIQLIVIWQSALPVKQAAAKLKYGAEAATSPDAKSFLEREEKSYIISVDGLPTYIQPRDEQAKQLLLKQTTLAAKGKEALVPTDVQFQKDGKNVDAYFAFPRSFNADDKEVEFVTKAGPIGVKQKFNLKNMMFNGKLEM